MRSNEPTSGKYPETDEIRGDLKSLRTDMGELAGRVKDESVQGISDMARKQYEAIADMGHRLEKKIRQQPAQSIAIAFASGVIASYLFGRK